MVTLHIRTYRESSRGQVLLTLLKLALIVLFIATAWLVGSQYPQQLPLASLLDVGEVATGAGAVALIYVTYAYSGWNAATYILGELEEPQRDLPRALVVGCTVVTACLCNVKHGFLNIGTTG
jgi:APA family basic amino acid/polyamine antiporter